MWLCWYLSGPMIEAFDSWDSPQEEMTDIASSQCGALVWIAAAACLALLAFRQFLKRSTYISSLGERPWMKLIPLISGDPVSIVQTGFAVASPPLRI
jgi:hypothetical protein